MKSSVVTSAALVGVTKKSNQQADHKVFNIYAFFSRTLTIDPSLSNVPPNHAVLTGNTLHCGRWHYYRSD